MFKEIKLKKIVTSKILIKYNILITMRFLLTLCSNDRASLISK